MSAERLQPVKPRGLGTRDHHMPGINLCPLKLCSRTSHHQEGSTGSVACPSRGKRRWLLTQVAQAGQRPMWRRFGGPERQSFSSRASRASTLPCATCWRRTSTSCRCRPAKPTRGRRGGYMGMIADLRKVRALENTDRLVDLPPPTRPSVLFDEPLDAVAGGVYRCFGSIALAPLPLQTATTDKSHSPEVAQPGVSRGMGSSRYRRLGRRSWLRTEGGT